MAQQDALNRALGNVLRRERNGLGLSQEELAERAEMHRTYVSQLERGLKSPSLARLADLADALRVPLAEFVARVMAERTLLSGSSDQST